MYAQDNICCQLCDRHVLLGMFTFNVLSFSLFLLKWNLSKLQQSKVHNLVEFLQLFTLMLLSNSHR